MVHSNKNNYKWLNVKVFKYENMYKKSNYMDRLTKSIGVAIRRPVKGRNLSWMRAVR